MPTKPLPVKAAPSYPSYKSPFGPKYTYQPHIAGWTPKGLVKLGVTSGAFGGVALFAVLFYASGIPRVQTDILQKVPYFGEYFHKEVDPADNPF